MNSIFIHMSIKIRILSLKSISFAMSNASCAWILLLSLFKDFFAKTLTDVRLDMGGNAITVTKAISPIFVTLFGILILVSELHNKYLLLVDYQYYTL